MWRGDGLRNHNHRGVNGGGWMPAPPATMKLISWNVRGLRKDRTFREIKRILRELKPEIVFLCETKLSEQLMKRKASELNFQNCFAISSSGKGGGLAMMWSENVNLEIKSYSKHRIDTCIKTVEGSCWRGTGVYGNPKIEERKHTWELLKRLSAVHLETWSSDHYPIVMEEIVRREWLEQSKWDGTITSEQFKKVAKRSLAELKLWSITEFGGREKKVKELINELKSVKHNFEHYMSGGKIKRLEKQIDNMLLDEEVYWKQRIEGVLDENGNWSIKAEEIERRFCEHFVELFTTTNPLRQQRESALKDMLKKVTVEMNKELGRPFTEEEIKEALFQMCPTKAPGPDDLPAVFFKKHWEAVKEGVTATFLHILNGKEALPNLLNEAEKKQLIRGLKFNKEISINHFLFADDSLIFSRATVEESMSLKQIFECYAAASGQIFYFEKSSMFFSGSISAEKMTKVRDIFQLKIVSKHEKYLGLPSMIGRKKVSFFKDIKLRILSKISSWQSKLFSSGGNETLIKPVAQAIPAYAMSVFRLPTTLCEDIRRVIAGFWRGVKKD
ncbi:reverse transcriptase domain-containing protein [Citrus sinensis]|nr:reverse transcriptase domain-containing protein [Citrus sinensis]